MKRLAFRRLGRGSRARVDALIDNLRFQLDTFPALDYQPLPWVGKPTAARGDGCRSRWRAIEPVLERIDAKTAMDIGANVGWFSFQLASRGLQVVALERVPKFYRPLLFTARRAHTDGEVSLLTIELSPRSAPLLPVVDCTVFLSVWHHLRREYGESAARSALREVWSHTNRVLFFETGELEMGINWVGDMAPNPRQWVTDLLVETCPNGRVEHLGTHPAFDPSGRPCLRNLFAVCRDSPYVP